ncbi:MAG: VWA domain-containing protein [Saprospiraceae bacterium]|jgi:uncharacterized protein YegL|nr:VWA domain-containing protein [Saprospiraceae bacterium]
MDKKHTIYNLIILDESGSMNSIKPFIINGFNELTETILSAQSSFTDQQQTVSLVSFNSGEIHTHFWNAEITKVRKLTKESYQPEGSTPLFDAIGSSADKLSAQLEGKNDFHVLVTILTDGEENASHHYTGAQIRKKIELLESRGWTFTYIGANHDVMLAAQNLSIKNAMIFEGNQSDIDRMFEKEKMSRMVFSQKISDKTWNQSDAYYAEDKPQDEPTNDRNK